MVKPGAGRTGKLAKLASSTLSLSILKNATGLLNILADSKNSKTV
jgi:hypothetical protein